MQWWALGIGAGLKRGGGRVPETRGPERVVDDE